MMFSTKFALILLLATPMLLASCSKDDPKPNNQDNEVITTVRYTLTPAGGGAAVFAQYRDADGDGGAAPVFSYNSGTRLTLDRSTTYTGRILLLDETKSPVDTISNEVLEEANDHLLVYKPLPTNLLTITRTDRDTNTPPLEIGLVTSLVTGATAGTGNLQVILRHQPGAKNGTETPGDTDVDVTFPVDVR